MKSNNAVKTVLLAGLLALIGSQSAHSPARLAEFLARDRTDRHAYTDAYQCRQFSEDLTHNLRAAGWETSYNLATFDDGEVHEFVAVHTSAGWIHVEPQSDAYYLNVREGRPLCGTNGFCIDDGRPVWMFTSQEYP